ETTGTDSAHDEILQVAAVRVSGGSPTGAFNRYVRTKSVELSESLRVRMGWEHIPDDDKVDLAGALGDLEKFVDGRTSVAWNAQFDTDFLSRAGLELVPVVDALPIGMLVLPEGAHRLTVMAERLGISLTKLPADMAVDGDDPRQFTAHDAVFDC